LAADAASHAAKQFGRFAQRVFGGHRFRAERNVHFAAEDDS
jgi:hypothetical protein